MGPIKNLVNARYFNAVAAEPGSGMRNRKKGQTVRAQRVFAPPVAGFAGRGRQGGPAAVLMWPFVKFPRSYLSVVCIKLSKLILSYGDHGVKPVAENGPLSCSSEAAGPLAASTKHFLFSNSPGYTLPTSYTRLERNVPFGTSGVYAGSRNFFFIAQQTRQHAPLLTRQSPGEFQGIDAGL